MVFGTFTTIILPNKSFKAMQISNAFRLGMIGDILRIFTYNE